MSYIVRRVITRLYGYSWKKDCRPVIEKKREKKKKCIHMLSKSTLTFILRIDKFIFLKIKNRIKLIIEYITRIKINRWFAEGVTNEAANCISFAAKPSVDVYCHCIADYPHTRGFITIVHRRSEVKFIGFFLPLKSRSGTRNQC